MHANILKAMLFVVLFGAGGFRHSFDPAQDVSEAERLLQKAILLEDVDGDLQAAIGEYEKVVAANGGNRAVAASALLRLGGCYEKLGRSEAEKTYRQLIQDYPDQVDAVNAAREKLNLLEKGNAGTSLRLIWEGPEVELMGAPSPDGRYICYTDWDTGDLAVHDLTTGENRRLSGQKEWDGSFAENSRWSPDGRLIVFSWTTWGNTADLRVVGLDGAKPRVVFSPKEFAWMTVEDWSPDGGRILVKLYTENSMWGPGYISLISTSDGSVRHLKKMERTLARYMKFSPDGKYIAFDYQNESTRDGITLPTDKDIYLLSADGKAQIPLIRHPADDYLLGWTPDGRNVLFASDRSGAIDAWILPVEGGKPAGAPRIVRRDIGAITPLGFARDGDFFYGHGRDLRNVYVAEIDRKADAMSATYKKLELPFEGRNSKADFSLDGRRLAFVRASNRRMSGGSGPYAAANNSLCIFSLDTREEKTFPLNLLNGSLRWSPDGSSILVGGFREMRSFVGIVDVRTGETRELFPTDKDLRQEMYLSPDWAPDGRSVYCTALRRTGPETECTIIAKDLETGRTRVVFKESLGLPLISVSPDGTRLAAYEHPSTGGKGGATERILRIISTVDGSARELCRFTNATNGTVFPRWSRDGRYILFPGIRKGGEKWDVWYVPAEGGEPVGMGLSAKRIEDVSPHPDGRFAFSSFGPTVHGPEVWVMENFLPAGGSDQK